jgi:hypothetical protein
MFDFMIDLIGLIFMFVVRIGIPIALTLIVGRWLEKKLAPQEEIRKPEETAQPTPRIREGNVIYVHCWDIKRCESTKRAQCAAFQHPELPCWLALQAAGEKVREECYTCAFYKPQTKVA